MGINTAFMTSGYLYDDDGKSNLAARGKLNLKIVVSSSRQKQAYARFCASSQSHMKRYRVLCITNVDVDSSIQYYLHEDEETKGRYI